MRWLRLCQSFAWQRDARESPQTLLFRQADARPITGRGPVARFVPPLPWRTGAKALLRFGAGCACHRIAATQPPPYNSDNDLRRVAGHKSEPQRRVRARDNPCDPEEILVFSYSLRS